MHAARFAPWLAETGAALTVRAHDPLRPQNERPVRLEPGGVCEGTEEDPVWIAADIQTLAQIYLGCLLPSQAREAGRLECSGPEAVALADRLFPDLEPFIAPPDRV